MHLLYTVYLTNKEEIKNIKNGRILGRENIRETETPELSCVPDTIPKRLEWLPNVKPLPFYCYQSWF
jgi:hypothetical protein